MPEISVVMPVYNGEKHIRETIESVLNQTFNDFEFIIVDDCSTDRTQEIILSYTDNRIKLIKNKNNSGVSFSANRGFDVATGEYLVRVDADDICIKDRFEKQLKFMKKNKDIGICGSAICQFNDNGDILTLELPTSPSKTKVCMLFRNPLAQPSVMMRLSTIKKYNLRYDSSIHYAEDYEFWTRCAQYMQLCSMPKVLLKYRIHGQQATQQFKYSEERKTIGEKIYRRMFNQLFEQPDEEEFKLFLRIIEGELAFDTYECEVIESIFKEAVISNQRNKNFDEKALKHKLAEIHHTIREKDGRKRKPIFQIERLLLLKRILKKIILIFRYKSLKVY